MTSDRAQQGAHIGASAMLRDVLDLETDAMFIIDVATLAYVGVNRAACELLGASREALMATGAGATGAYSAMRHETLREHYADLVRQAPEPFHYRTTFVRADGGRIEMELTRRAFQSEGRWCIAVRGRPLGADAVLAARGDIERFRQMMGNSADEAMALVDFQSMRYVEVNDAMCRLLGHTRERMVELGPAGVAGVDEGTLGASYGRIVMHAPQPMLEELALTTGNGQAMHARAIRYAFMADGRWVIFSTLQDQTARQEAERKARQHVVDLQRSNQELERFAYVASHDLSEPLRMVASYTQLLERRYGPKLDDEAREFIGFAVDGARRMKRLIDDLLTYSRAGRPDAPLREVEMNAVLDDALKNLEQLVADKGALIERGELPRVRGDATALVQLMQNLVGNAMKFVKDGVPVVGVSARRGEGGDAGHWIVSVRDNGVGIEPQYFNRIFELFQRLHTQDKFQGTGLGLAICKKIVDRHGGRIWVESVPGQGSTFLFSIPALRDGDAARPAAS